MNTELNLEGVIVKRGKMAGKTLAVFCGVHGNETVGVLAVKDILKQIDIERGSVYFVFANPPAIKVNLREIDKNLNRLFYKDNSGNSYEDQRARDLMKILDQCDALLDIHASNSLEATPFIICENDSFEFAEKLNFRIITIGWDNFQKGSSDGYMHSQNKPGICLECGSVHKPEESLQLTKDSIITFLSHYGTISNQSSKLDIPRTFMRITSVGIKSSDNFGFTKQYSDFEQLEPGLVFAYDGEREYIAAANQYIIFPRLDKPIGGEVFVLAEKEI